ncbi:M56 family metallopeptidase [Yoonia sp. SS1-5]|uniref:M56 family metallopeptidase n=1 Tax=Yoonia rhodophyticola TaxID=3137370 RepID=A0AAN0NJ54_9RHOB
MIAEKLLNAYIDVNIVLLAAAAMWFCLRKLITRSPWRIAFLTQLQLLYTVIAMVMLAPLIVFGFESFQRNGYLAAPSGLSFSDFLVAQYLHGNIAMAPTKFEHLLTIRSEVVRDFATLSSLFSQIIVAMLAIGGVLVALRNLRNIWQIRQMIHRSYVLRRVGRVDVRFTEETRVPFSTRGFRRFYIVLPTVLLAHADDVRIAVTHEIQHVRQRDLGWEIGMELLRPIFFWNPAFVFCKREVERMRELACDQQILGRRILGVRDYCECLLRVCKTGLGTAGCTQVIAPTVPFVHLDHRAKASQSAPFLKQRILSILDRKAIRGSRYLATGLTVLVAALVVSTTLALRPVNDWSHDRLMLSTIVNLERLNSRTIIN